MTFTATTNWQEVDGEAKLSTPYAPLVNFNKVEDYTKTDLELKCTYSINEFLDLTFGYLYEDYDFDDQQWSDYNNVVISPFGFDGSYLTGAYAEDDYEVNTGYILATYRF